MPANGGRGPSWQGQNTLLARSSLISASPAPRRPKISALCWPSLGATLRTRTPSPILIGCGCAAPRPIPGRSHIARDRGGAPAGQQTSARNRRPGRKHSGRLKHLDPMIGGLGSQHRVHHVLQCLAVCHALPVGRKTRVLAPFGVPQRLGTARPDRPAGRPHHQIAVRGLHALVGSVLAMARALPGRLLMVGEPLRRGPGAKADRGFQLRAFDEPALAGALPHVDRDEDALRRPMPLPRSQIGRPTEVGGP
jgi:hypothetical protein